MRRNAERDLTTELNAFVSSEYAVYAAQDDNPGNSS
jgi:hypothetical protein